MKEKIMAIIEKHFPEYIFPESSADWSNNYQTVQSVLKEIDAICESGDDTVHAAFIIKDAMDAIAGKNQLNRFSFLYAIHQEYGEYFNIYA